jgi:hypothetical protein
MVSLFILASAFWACLFSFSEDFAGARTHNPNAAKPYKEMKEIPDKELLKIAESLGEKVGIPANCVVCKASREPIQAFRP